MYVLSRAGTFCYYKVNVLDQRVDVANSVRMKGVQHIQLYLA